MTYVVASMGSERCFTLHSNNQKGTKLERVERFVWQSRCTGAGRQVHALLNAASAVLHETHTNIYT